MKSYHYLRGIILVLLTTCLIYADPPNWDCDGDGSLDNFNQYQKLQEEIKSTLFNQEPVSVLKAFLAHKQNNLEWNRVLPPLKRIDNPLSNKTIINLLELTKKMENLLANS